MSGMRVGYERDEGGAMSGGMGVGYERDEGGL
jgi:hypothetical protein